MDLSETPHGYKQIVPLEKNYRLRLPESGEAPRFCHDLSAVPISASEFPIAMRDYPIVFVRTNGGLDYSSMVILGMQQRQNLFVMGDGRWDRRAYMPAYVRRYPFCMVNGDEEASDSAKPLICVDPDAIDDQSGRLMFDEQGAPLPHWNIIERMLHEYEDDLSMTRDMCRLLARLELLEPFTLRAELVGGFSLSMDNLFRVNRDRLPDVGASDFRDLLRLGYVDHIYAHLFSQDNFQRLLGRRSFFATEPPASPNQYN